MDISLVKEQMQPEEINMFSRPILFFHKVMANNIYFNYHLIYAYVKT